MGRIRKNHFLLIGLSHKTAPVEVREEVSFDTDSYPDVLRGIRALPGIAECVLLSTCNRTEVYAITAGKPRDAESRLGEFILRAAGAGKDVADCFYTLRGEKVIEHLFRVVSGLDSMILGEPQIFGQVKDAYAAACDAKTTGPILNRLFHHAFRAGKLVRNSTAVGEGAVSVSFAAVEQAKKVFADLEGRSVLLIGAGKTGELSAKRLLDSGVGRLYIANRTRERARELTGKLAGEAVPFDELYDVMERVDIVISSVASREPVVTRALLLPHVVSRRGGPLLLIDLGVPRNVEPEVAGMDGVTLFNIDDLEGLTLDNMDRRRLEAEKAGELISGEVGEFCSWLSEREIIPVIRGLHVKCENIRLEEMEKIRNKVAPETYETIDVVTRRIVRKILHNPVIAMRGAVSDTVRERLLESVEELFIKEKEPKK